MEGCGDVVLVLSTIAAAAALGFRWSSDRAAKRALALLRANAADREPGLTLEVIGAVFDAVTGIDDIELRITNPAGSWNVATALALESADTKKTFQADSRGNEALKVPFVIQANQVVTGHVFFDVRGKYVMEGSIVLVDLDGRSRRAQRQ